MKTQKTLMKERELVQRTRDFIKFMRNDLGMMVLPIDEVKIGRFRSYAGICYRHQNHHCDIELSEALVDCSETVQNETILHELVHATTLNGMDHDEEFEMYAEILNECFDVHIGHFMSDEASAEFNPLAARYVVTCPHCGKKHYHLIADDVVKNTDDYQCAACQSDGLLVHRCEHGKEILK